MAWYRPVVTATGTIIPLPCPCRAGRADELLPSLRSPDVGRAPDFFRTRRRRPVPQAGCRSGLFCGHGRRSPQPAGAFRLKSSERLAIAFDLGTTTIAASLLDPGTGERLAAAGALNPQREFGADVVSRLDAACDSPENLKRLAGSSTGSWSGSPRNSSPLPALRSGTLPSLPLRGTPPWSISSWNSRSGPSPSPPTVRSSRRERWSVPPTLGWHKDIDACCCSPCPGGSSAGTWSRFSTGLVPAPDLLAPGPDSTSTSAPTARWP